MAEPRMDSILSSVTAMVGKVFGGGQDDPPSGNRGRDESVGPTVNQGEDPQGLVTLEMDEEEMGKWWDRIKESDTRIKMWAEQWDILINEYMPIVAKSGVAETVKTNVHFRNVHTKIGQLFYRAPDPVLVSKTVAPKTVMPYPTPQNPQGTLTIEEITTLKQEILRNKLGRTGIKVERLFDELLFDCLAWSHLACSKIGYQCTFKKVQRPKMVPQPTPPGAVLGLSGPAQPHMVPDPAGATESVKVPVHESYYWRRFSPKKLIMDADLRSTRFDEDATLMGQHFFWSPEKVAKTFGIPLDELSGIGDERQYLHEYESDKIPTNKGLVHGVELFVKANVYTEEVHPQALCQLVLIEGYKKKPAIWRPSPDQEFDPATGRLTEDSLIGFPIRVLTIRDLADSPAPPSDAAFENSLAKQANVSRRQGIKYRDAAIGKMLYDGSKFEDSDVDRIKNGEVGDFLEVEEGALANGVDRIMASTAQLHASPDDYRLEASIRQDIQDTLGLSSVQSGNVNATIHTATEINATQLNANSRNDKELNRVVDHYLEGVQMLDQLLMRYASETEYAAIVGQDNERKLLAWNNKLIKGSFEYDIAPDSQLRMDTARDFQLDSQFYNLTARDPLSNRLYVLRRMAQKRGMDPMKAFPPPPPPPPPQPPKATVNLALKGEDIVWAANNPLHPGSALILALAEQARVPEPIAPANAPPHGGAAPTAEVISDHQLAQSGRSPHSPGASDFRAERKS